MVGRQGRGRGDQGGRNGKRSHVIASRGPACNGCICRTRGGSARASAGCCQQPRARRRLDNACAGIRSSPPLPIHPRSSCSHGTRRRGRCLCSTTSRQGQPNGDRACSCPSSAGHATCRSTGTLSGASERRGRQWLGARSASAVEQEATAADQCWPANDDYGRQRGRRRRSLDCAEPEACWRWRCRGDAAAVCCGWRV